jgi:hypothetical protein
VPASVDPVAEMAIDGTFCQVDEPPLTLGAVGGVVSTRQTTLAVHAFPFEATAFTRNVCRPLLSPVKRFERLQRV